MTANAKTFSYEDLIRCGEGTLFDPRAPRLPLPPMLMFDRITQVRDEGGRHGQGEITAESDIRPNLWFFACHFRGDPVMPGCLGLDGLWQLSGFFLGYLGCRGRGRALSTGEVKFLDQITPSVRRLVYRIHPRRFVRRVQMLVADGEVEADGRVMYRAQDLRVIVMPHETEASEALSPAGSGLEKPVA